MYETSVYNARKIRDFSDILSGFEKLSKISDIFENSPVLSPLLVRAVKSNTPSQSTTSAGYFPSADMKKLLAYFRGVFDEKQAKRDGTIKPKPGILYPQKLYIYTLKSISLM
jgi:hypothetical protein